MDEKSVKKSVFPSKIEVQNAFRLSCPIIRKLITKLCRHNYVFVCLNTCTSRTIKSLTDISII